MIGEHYLWWLLTIACVVWYCTITVYVAIKGLIDIKEMLTRLAEPSDTGPDSPDDPASQDQSAAEK